MPAGFKQALALATTQEEVEQQLCAGGTTVAAEVQAAIGLDLF